MNMEFLKLILDKTLFPIDAKDEVLRCASLLDKGAFCEATQFFFDNDFNIEKTGEYIDTMAEKAEVSPYTVWLVLLLSASEKVKPLYDKYGVDNLFWDTFSDLKFKAYECKNIHDVWGNFVAFWYPIFYRGNIIKLGCFEYENLNYYFDKDYTFGDITVKKGEAVKSVHIPSSGEPFDAKSRLDSYRKAYEIFKAELGDKPLICVCDSWLLYPEYRDILPDGSNIRSFMDDFDLVTRHDSDSFDDAWRVFGSEHQKAPQDLPEKTSLQRVFKKQLIDGGKVGTGQGVMIFDGEKIINR